MHNLAVVICVTVPVAPPEISSLGFGVFFDYDDDDLKQCPLIFN